MSITDSQRHLGARAALRRLAARIATWRTDGSDRSIARRIAGTAFLIRVASAAIVYVSQVLLARWMGRFEFGIYVYVWAWVGLLGMLATGGIAPAAQRFIPEYRTAGDAAGLRGFLRSSPWLSFAYGSAVALLLAGVMLAFAGDIAPYYRVPFLVGAAAIAIFPVSSVQDTISRAFNWIELGLLPNYVIGPLAVVAALAAIHALGGTVTALHGLVAAAAGFWAMTLMQTALLRRCLARVVAPGARTYACRRWMATALPIALVDGFVLLLTYVDTLVLQLFVGPAEVATYYAATKTLALINFIYFAVAAATAHRFAQYGASGEREKLAGFVKDAVGWTFWPSLVLGVALLALGRPILALFGPGFADGYPLMFVLVIGLMARASIGPAERLLSMQGQQTASAAIYAGAFGVNLVLCLILIPRFGLIGAAISTATALVCESTLLFVTARRRLGVHSFVFGR